MPNAMMVVMAAGMLTGQPQGEVGAQIGRQPGAEARQSYRGEALQPLERFERPFRFVEGEQEGETIRLTVRPEELGAGGERWVMSFGDYRDMTISRSDGAIVLHSETLPEQGYRFEYSPPVPIVPAMVESRRERQVEGEVKVFNLEDGELRTTGTYTHTVRPVGETTMRVNSDTARAIVIETTRVADLDMADVEAAIEYAYVPGSGIVYMRAKTTQEKLGLFSETSVNTLRALEVGGVGAGARGLEEGIRPNRNQPRP